MPCRNCIKHRWDAIQQANEEMEEAKTEEERRLCPYRYSNGDTRGIADIRSRGICCQVSR